MEDQIIQPEARIAEEEVDAPIKHSVKSPIMETIGASKVYAVGKDMVSPATDITLQIGFGDFAIIFGPSGAGKSTLINMLMGLERPDVGGVFIKGNSLYGYSEESRTTLRRKKISYLPQAQYWLEYMDLLDNVSLPLILNGNSMHRARIRSAELLKEVGLDGFFHHHPKDLSTGQQQKAALARAIIKEPWLIFADEPTAHLDTKSVDEVTTILLESSKKYGITTVMVTHDLSLLRLSDKWFFMRDGRLWEIKDRSNPFEDIRDAIAYVDASGINPGGIIEVAK